MNKYIICHYNEIGLKGGNRKFFEEKLIENIKKALPSNLFRKIKRISGRIIIETIDLKKEQKKIAKEKLEKIFGIAYFCFTHNSKQDIDSIKKIGYKILEKKIFNSFCIRVKRSNKNILFSSTEIEKRIGAFILNKFKKKVDLENPEITLFIELVEEYTFLYTQKIKGLGGLPVGTSGKALCFLSDGIDSPVAAWQMMKRGLRIIFIHFHSYQEEEKSIKKIVDIVKKINEFQLNSKLYLIPFKNVQKEIFKDKNKYCCLICKRAMIEIALNVAKKEKCFNLITGENLGQVASQTIDNLSAIQGSSKFFFLRPLISFDKNEIIEIAQRIGTYQLSIMPSNFYCQKYLPKHPITKPDFERIKEIEKKLKLKKVLEESFKKSKIEIF